MVTLVELLEEDGVRWGGPARGANRLAHCPFHDDKNPSFSVEIRKGLYKCFSCGVRGDAVTYLTDKRGMPKTEAVRLAGKGKKPPPEPDKPKPITTVETLPQYDARYDYRDEKGKLAFIILRWQNRRKGRKEFTPYFRGKKGGKVVWGRAMPPKYRGSRPLYRLPELLAAPPEQQVMIVEGEKCADAVVKAFPRAVVTTWTGGAGAVTLVDIAPLADRPNVLLVADADKPGHEAMKAMAVRLRAGSTCAKKIRIILPKPGDDLPEHHDIADVLEGGTKKAVGWLRSMARDWQSEASKDKGDSDPDIEVDPDIIARNDFFHVVGHDGDMVAFVLRTSAVVTLRRRDLLNPNTLLALAPDESWWCEKLRQEKFSAPVARAVGTAIIRRAESLPKVDPARMLGRGAHRNDADLTWNMGDALLRNGERLPMGGVTADGEYWIGGAPIIIGTADNVPMEKRREIARRIGMYRWSSPEDGRAMLGWLVTSVIGGALDWRPHLWFVAEAAQGKTWFVENVVAPVHKSLSFAASDPTEAGIARIMGNDSLPLVIDEAEPDQSWLNSVLKLCRVAAGGFGARVRADGAGSGSTQFYPRFSALLMSTTMPNVRKADRSRFAAVTLGAPIENWPEFRKWVVATFRRSDMPTRLRGTMIRETRFILDKQEEFQARLESHGTSGRDAAILSALEAGWWWWTGEEVGDESTLSVTITDRGAKSDAVALIEDILQAKIRYGTQDFTIMDLARRPQDLEAARELAAVGIRRRHDGLMIAPDVPNLSKALSRTQWAGTNLRRLLLQVEGAQPLPNPLWFAGMKKRAIFLRSGILAAAGIRFDDDSSVDEQG